MCAVVNWQNFHISGILLGVHKPLTALEACRSARSYRFPHRWLMSANESGDGKSQFNVEKLAFKSKSRNWKSVNRYNLLYGALCRLGLCMSSMQCLRNRNELKQRCWVTCKSSCSLMLERDTFTISNQLMSLWSINIVIFWGYLSWN